MVLFYRISLRLGPTHSYCSAGGLGFHRLIAVMGRSRFRRGYHVLLFDALCYRWGLRGTLMSPRAAVYVNSARRDRSVIDNARTGTSPSSVQVDGVATTFRRLFPTARVSQTGVNGLVKLSHFAADRIANRVISGHVLHRLNPSGHRKHNGHSRILTVSASF